LGDLRHAGFPVVLVFAVEGPGVALGGVFGEDGGDVTLAGAEGEVRTGDMGYRLTGDIGYSWRGILCLGIPHPQRNRD